ncbi:MAG: hypothetical protein ACYC96_02935 [Fimbriimonadaceae bacterium]
MKSFVSGNRTMWTLAMGAMMAGAVASGGKNTPQTPKPPPPPRVEAPRPIQRTPAPVAPRPIMPVQPERTFAPRPAAPAQNTYLPNMFHRVATPRNYVPAPTKPRPPRFLPLAPAPTQGPAGSPPTPKQHVIAPPAPRLGGFPTTGSYHIAQPTQAGQSGQGPWQGRGQGGQGSQGRPNSAPAGRAGHADYHGSNNRFTSRDSHPHWSPPPVMSVSQFRAHQLRTLRDAHTVYGDHARRGYFGYDRDWRDSSFTYPFYVFDPYNTFGFLSPWYFYPSLPGYISPDRCTFVDAGLLPPVFVGAEYTSYPLATDAAYQQGYAQGVQDAQQADQQATPPADNRILDGALDDIVAVFSHDDQRALDRLVGETGNVNIYVDGRYSYSLAANDFYDLMRDNAGTTHTVDYQILDVKVNGSEAKVIALHTFKDPWGDTEKVYHTYTLKVGQRGAQITDYGTSATRPE